LQSAVQHIKQLQFMEPENIQCPVACLSLAIQSNSFKDYSSATMYIMPRDRGWVQQYDQHAPGKWHHTAYASTTCSQNALRTEQGQQGVWCRPPWGIQWT